MMRLAKMILLGILVGSPILMGQLEAAAGLHRTLATGNSRHDSISETLELYVPAGESPTAFLPPGVFTARWEGKLEVELRSDFTFHAECRGDLTLTINETPALEVRGGDGSLAAGKQIRLNKGANRIVAEFRPPASGDAALRVYWSNRETPLNPIPRTQWSHADSDPLKKGLRQSFGRQSILEGRCVQCHTLPNTSSKHPELELDAPALTGIGSRRNFSWLAAWIADPTKLRPDAHMPKVFTGSDAPAKSRAVAAYLSSLKTASAEVKSGDVAAGKLRFETLHCAACHGEPGTEPEPGKVSQKQVRSKFAPGALASFLQKPEEHYRWIRMPNFHLSPTEASDLAAFLDSVSDAPSGEPAPADPKLIAEGRQLVRSSGCLQCHSIADEKSAFVAARPLLDLAPDRWTVGCLAESDAARGKAPNYSLTQEQRVAMREWANADRASLSRGTAAEALHRWSQTLHCTECHGKIEGLPAWELLGGKLKPEWTEKFLSGAPVKKPRPWLDARMPAFPAYARWLAVGLSTAHGLPPTTASDPAPADASELAGHGKKLVSANGGFSCISCHGAGEFAATQVFEAPGINLAYSFERLQPSYFKRWLRSPISIDPTTKMPVYFDETGQSPLNEILGGDGPKTITAIWEYLRRGDKMERPE